MTEAPHTSRRGACPLEGTQQEGAASPSVPSFYIHIGLRMGVGLSEILKYPGWVPVPGISLENALHSLQCPKRLRIPLSKQGDFGSVEDASREDKSQKESAPLPRLCVNMTLMPSKQH